MEMTSSKLTVHSEVSIHDNNNTTTSSSNVVVATPISKEDSAKLYKYNLALGIFHTITGIIIGIITDRDATVPVYSNFSDADTRGRPSEWYPRPKKHFDCMVGYFAMIFLLLAGIDHLLVATVFRKSYEEQLSRQQNHYRWMEYSISASFMHLLVAQLSGIFDIHINFLIFGLTFLTMIFGSEQERYTWLLKSNGLLNNNNKLSFDSLRFFWLGCIPHLFNWLVILCYFFQGVSKGDPPGFVWAIIFIIFFLDASFAIAMFLQQYGYGKWKDYLYGEYTFLILSLVSKQLLAWVNFGGTRALNSPN